MNAGEDPSRDKAERLIRSVLLFLLSIAIIAVPAMFSPWTVESGRLKVLALHLVVGCMAVIIVMYAAWAGAFRFPKHGLHWAIGIWLLVNAASVVASPYPYSSLNELWRVAIWVGLHSAVVWAVRSRRAVRALAGLCVLATTLVVGYGIAQHLGYDVVTYSQSPQDRLFSSLGNPNMLAGFLLLMLWTIVGLGLDAKRLWVRVGLGLLAAGMLWCLVLTYTKGAWIALAVSCLIAFAWFISGWRLPFALSRRRRLGLLAISGAVVGLTFLIAHRPILGRLYTLKDSAAVRMVYWAGARGVVQEHPVFGTGIGTFQIVYPDKRPSNFRAAGATYNTLHAHCEPLEILTELGIVGLLCWGWLLFAFYRGVFRTLARGEQCPTRGLMAGMMLGITALLLHNLVDVNLRWYSTPTYFWLFLGLSVAISRLGDGASQDDMELSLPESSAARWALAVVFVAALGATVKVRVVDAWRSEVCYRKGQNLAQRAQWSAALGQTDRAIALDPSNLRAYYQQAYCYYEQKMYGEAIRSYLHLEQLAPHFCQLQYNLAIVYSLMGRWEEAAERFIRAEKSGIAPEGFSSAGLIAKLRAAGADQEKYLAVLQKVIELNPHDPLAHNRLGIYYYERDEFGKAAEEFRKAIEADAAYVPALNNLAGSYYRQKDYPKAIEMCVRILAINPQSHKTRVNLGRAYFLTGQREKAVAHWMQVLQTAPNEPEALACLRELGGGGKP